MIWDSPVCDSTSWNKIIDDPLYDPKSRSSKLYLAAHMHDPERFFKHALVTRRNANARKRKWAALGKKYAYVFTRIYSEPE